MWSEAITSMKRKDDIMALKRKSILLIMVFLIGCFVCACGKEDSVAGESLVEDTEEVSSTEKIKNAEEEAAVQWEKGYNLPVDEQEKEEAESDCKKLMELYLDIYETADKGIASNVVLDNQTVLEMQKKIKDAGYPIATMVTYSTIENYESVDSFLKECMEGKRGSVVIYEIHNDGGLGRMKFIFDGTDMYVVSTRGIRNADNKLGISYISYTRLKEWKYTEKGWFCYELCVPEPPEVSEIVDGSCLIRIKPMTEEQREMSERCVRGLGYQGNNLLCSNWNIENLNELDYNGMFEYLYGMKYGEKFNSEDYPNGIPKEKFESLIMEYLPITAEQIRDYAVFDEENQTYDLYPISLFPDIHVGQDRHGYFSCVASGSIAVCTNVGSEKVCIIYSFDIADKPSVHILAIHTSGSGLSVECSGIGRGKADGIFYCIDIFRGEAKAVILQPG